ncbi:MAG TPA: phospholipase D-like domain-containing protein [Candidatus Methylomirabilis sp.]|nr:phospholipase D-like domain-containing protein [Candidatus Methylomirabilis sp.]
MLGRASTSLILCAPYVGRGPCDRVRRRLVTLRDTEFEMTMLTDLSRDNILSGATDVSAIVDVVRDFPTAMIRFLPSLHAKIYVADETCAIITSANLTDSGLSRNLEYGMLFDEPQTVRQIKLDVLQYASLGSPIDRAQLDEFAAAVAELRAMRQAAERSLRSRFRREFDRRLRQVGDALLRARAAGRSAHAIYADTILHLLRQGPMSTVEINRAIKRIHPDLCDDTIDRVIDGQHFGKKWKHAVRTAQAHLRRRGDIQREGGRWQLTV